MKVLFTDIDGVVGLTGYSLSAPLVKELLRIVEATGCQVVISSTWRFDPDLREKLLKVFKKLNIPVAGETLDLAPQPRSAEIVAWLQDNQVDGFAILDDNPESALPGHFFHVDPGIGLNAEVADEVITYLNGGTNMERS